MLKSFESYVESGIFNDQKIAVKAAKAFFNANKGRECNDIYSEYRTYMLHSHLVWPDECDFKFLLQYKFGNDGGEYLVGLRVVRSDYKGKLPETIF